MDVYFEIVYVMCDVLVSDLDKKSGSVLMRVICLEFDKVTFYEV